jgi:SAM-dependent methyltransferase
MRPTIQDLRSFYDSPTGRRAALEIGKRVRPRLMQRSSDRVLTIGYTLPFIEGLRHLVERLVVLMPATQGVQAWPAMGPNCAVLGDESALPFCDAVFDQIVCIHCLEHLPAQREAFREMWRVLAPAGRLLVVTPNRTSPWTHFETTPFGAGQPYGRRQLDRLLRDHLFEPTSWDSALVMPPFKLLTPFEGAARWLAPELGGVHIVTARKSDGYAGAKSVLSYRTSTKIATSAKAFISHVPDLTRPPDT